MKRVISKWLNVFSTNSATFILVGSTPKVICERNSHCLFISSFIFNSFEAIFLEPGRCNLWFYIDDGMRVYLSLANQRRCELSLALFV